jgi:hypothetical protein
MTQPDDQTATLFLNGIKHIQQITGILLYYAHAVNPTMLKALRTSAAQ